MKYYFLSLFLFVALNAVAQAPAQDVYVCVNEKGQRSYTNIGNTKNCKKVELLGLTTIESPPAQVKRSQNIANGGKSISSPNEFPKVDDPIQKARDNDRKQILMDELRSEEQKLAGLKRDFQGGLPERNGDEKNFAKYQARVEKMKDNIGRTEKNLEALKRELSNIK
jgi:Domain of unknown function (DUF4124)